MSFRQTLVLSSLLAALSAGACSSVGSKTAPKQPTAPVRKAGPPPHSPPQSSPESSSDHPPHSSISTTDRVVLPVGVELSDIRVDGRDLIITLPDGSTMTIPGGALFVPELVIGNVEYPAGAVAALLIEPVAKVASRLFVPPRFRDFGRYGAVAMIAFPQVPASIEGSKRNQQICEAYLTTLPDAVVTNEHDPNLRQMVTIWPRTDIAKPTSVDASTIAAATAECNRALRNYDFAAATAWLARVPRSSGLNRTRRGPFLVAWAPSSAIGKPGSALLLFDLSDFEQPSAIQRAFRIWKVEIENDPKLWNEGWNIERWKAHTAARLDRYGKQISSALKLLPWKS